jgi:UDP-2,3-diacylglucosamine hydrolase
VATVVGTPVWAAIDDARPHTILVSDLHLPLDGGPALAQLGRLLDSIDVAPATRLIVLGDLFDAYITPRQNAGAVFRDTAAVLAQAAAAGVSITLLHGNRDFMLDQRFGHRAGCRVVPGGLLINLGGVPGLLLHGDELCQRDLPYQRAKRLLRHPITRFVLRRLPLGLAMRLARRARARSARVIASGDQTRFDPTAAALREVFAGEVAVHTLVFGHIHRPARGRFVDGAVRAGGGAADEGSGCYAILPAFDATGVCLEHRDGALRYRDAAGVAVADYPAREFC